MADGSVPAPRIDGRSNPRLTAKTVAARAQRAAERAAAKADKLRDALAVERRQKRLAMLRNEELQAKVAKLEKSLGTPIAEHADEQLLAAKSELAKRDAHIVKLQGLVMDARRDRKEAQALLKQSEDAHAVTRDELQRLRDLLERALDKAMGGAA